MERPTNETSCGSGASLTGVQFGKDLGELVKRMDVWSSQVENVLRDSTATTAFIRASAQG